MNKKDSQGSLQIPSETGKIVEVLKEEYKKIRNEIQELREEVQNNIFETKNGISYLGTKYTLLLNYCINLLFYFLLRLSGKSCENHPVIKRLIEQRIIIEKIKPIDEKMNFTIKKLIRIASSSETIVNIEDRPNLDNIESDEEVNEVEGVPNIEENDISNEKDDSDDDRNENLKRNIEREELERLVRRRNRERGELAKRIKNSSLVKEMEFMFDDKPEERSFIGSEIMENEDSKEIEDFEDENMVRLINNKISNQKKKIRKKRLNTFENEIDNLGSFKEIENFANLLKGKEVEEIKFNPNRNFSRGRKRKRQSQKSNSRGRKRRKRGRPYSLYAPKNTGKKNSSIRVIGTSAPIMSENEKPEEKKSEEEEIAPKKYCYEDFKIGDQIGEGTYSVVYKANFTDSRGGECALKKLDMKLIIKENLTKTIYREREILLQINHPNICRLYGTFKTVHEVYFVLQYAPNSLTDLIQKNGRLTYEAVKYYMADLVLALEYLHGKGIVHRDVKPENLLVTDDNKHLLLSDFGTAKVLRKKKSRVGQIINIDDVPHRKGTWIGTPTTVSPELLSSSKCYLSSDLWALGVIIFYLITGTYPFSGPSEYLMFQKINKRIFHFPDTFPEDAEDLVDKLLVTDPLMRIGAGKGGYEVLKKHKFFEGIEWEKQMDAKPPQIIFVKEKKKEKMEKKQEIYKDWSNYLCKNESIIFTSSIIKRRHLSTKTRQLILTNRPRLIYIDPVTKTQKGSIPLSTELTTVKTNSKKFLIKVPGRTYDIECLTDCVDAWIRHINRLSLK